MNVKTERRETGIKKL